MSGIEMLILLVGIVVVIAVIRRIARSFSGRGNYSGGDYSHRSTTGTSPGIKYNETPKKKPWGMNDPNRQHKQFMDSAKKASENAAKTYNDIQKRSAATRKQVDDMTRKTIKRNRGW